MQFHGISEGGTEATQHQQQFIVQHGPYLLHSYAKINYSKKSPNLFLFNNLLLNLMYLWLCNLRWHTHALAKAFQRDEDKLNIVSTKEYQMHCQQEGGHEIGAHTQ